MLRSNCLLNTSSTASYVATEAAAPSARAVTTEQCFATVSPSVVIRAPNSSSIPASGITTEPVLAPTGTAICSISFALTRNCSPSDLISSRSAFNISPNGPLPQESPHRIDDALVVGRVAPTRTGSTRLHHAIPASREHSFLCMRCSTARDRIYRVGGVSGRRLGRQAAPGGGSSMP